MAKDRPSTTIATDAADYINAAHTLAISSMVDAVEHAIECGGLLVQQKKRMGAKQGPRAKNSTRETFQEWVEGNCTFGWTTAWRYTQTYHNREQIRSESADSLRKALRLTTDHSERESTEPEPVEATALGIHHVDFREHAASIADGSIPLIFTDPPYDKDSTSLIVDLAAVADLVLMPGGSLIFYCGHLQTGDAINAVTATSMRLWWICCCLHSGAHARMPRLGVVAGWKPILWFCKAPMRDRSAMLLDVVSGGREKDAHDWQQSESEAAHFIEALTREGETVWDPMAGGGTTCVAAKKLKRKWIGCDVDPAAIRKARERINAG